jgi:hypothetical protein
MSVYYDISVHLGVSYSQENIYALLKTGEELGFIYYDYVCGERYADSPILNITDAVKKVMSFSPETFDNENSIIYTKLEDTYFYLAIHSKNNLILLSIGGFSQPWKKKFDYSHGGNTHMIDFARYIRVMLKMCKEFVILDLATETD